MNEHDFDLIIVGAGPAGASAAFTARRLGLSVAMLDKAVFPRNKLCGALLSGRSLKALDAIFGERPSRDMFLISRQAMFSWQGEPLVHFETPYDLWFTMRHDFDHDLCKRALQAGAVDFTGRRWKELDPKGVLTLDDGQVLRFKSLIAADGVTSPVAAHLFGRAFDPDKIGFALECEISRDESTQNVMQVDFHGMNWGYGWSFPKHKTLTIGVGGVHAENPDIRDAIEALLDDPDSAKIKGAFLPFGDYRRHSGQGNILFAGDAAGLVDPLTGEGIAYAMESGDMAARALAEALNKGKPDGAGRAYMKMLKPIHSDLSRANKLRHFAFSKRFEGVFRDRLQNSVSLRQAFFDLLEGETTYREIEKKAARGVLKKFAKGVGLGPIHDR